jgi:hypothetical protein
MHRAEQIALRVDTHRLLVALDRLCRIGLETRIDELVALFKHLLRSQPDTFLDCTSEVDLTVRALAVLASLGALEQITAELGARWIAALEEAVLLPVAHQTEVGHINLVHEFAELGLQIRASGQHAVTLPESDARSAEPVEASLSAPLIIHPSHLFCRPFANVLVQTTVAFLVASHFSLTHWVA